MRGRGVVVAVIDSGWNRNLRDTRVKSGVGISRGNNAASVVSPNEDADQHGHGTACGIVILRIAPAATIVPVRVFDKMLETSATVIEAAIEWSLAQGIRVLNLSLGTADKRTVPRLYKACHKAAQRGAILVCASAPGRVSYPAAFDNVISVSIAQRNRAPCGYEVCDQNGVEFTATGVYTLDTGFPQSGSPSRFVGASIASATVSGNTALLVERWPNLTLETARAKLREQAISWS